MPSFEAQDDRVAKQLRTHTIERLWNLTTHQEVLIMNRWMALADMEMMRYFTLFSKIFECFHLMSNFRWSLRKRSSSMCTLL